MQSSNQTETESKIILYTDGSCAPTNPGPGGWAYLTVVGGKPKEVIKGSEAHSTNNRMELTAAIEALKTCTDGQSVELFTDSEYLRLGISQWMHAWIRNGWMRRRGQPVLNKDLWIELHAQNTRLNVNWKWVKAHAGHAFNEQVDQAARDAAISEAGRDHGLTRTSNATKTTTTNTRVCISYFIAAASNGENRSSWALVRVDDGEEDTSYDVLERSTSNRSLLVGVIALMRSLSKNETVRVTTDSEYLYKGITQWLDGWERRGWRKSDDKPVANKDLWLEIHALLPHVTIDWQLERRKDDHLSVSLMHVAARAAREALDLS